MYKTRLILAWAILAVLWVVVGDQTVYWFEKMHFSNPCKSFTASVKVWREQEDGRYVLGNGVYIAESVVLTSKHLANKNLSLKTIWGIADNVKILAVVAHPNLDLAILILNQPLPIPFAVLSEETLEDSHAPYMVSSLNNGLEEEKFAGNYFEITDLDQFLIQHESRTMIRFRNKATLEGDSGAALLNNHCNLIGLVSGGNGSFLGGLRPTSYYINLMNRNILDWIIDSSG
jgi:hypothetical protein